MVAAAGAAARAQARSGPIAPIDRLARWLLWAVALDLVVTRFLVRLAIFVPKGEPFATLAAVGGRIGAATDALVPLVGILLLGALLLRAGQAGGLAERATLAGVAVVAVGGFALVVLPPAPSVLVVVGLLTSAIAGVAAVRVLASDQIPVLARLGLGSLAVAVGCASLASAVDAWPTTAWDPDGRSGPMLTVLGQSAFVAGAALMGLAGFVAARRAGQPIRRMVVAGAVVAGVLLVAWMAAPLTWSALAIWSIGLSAVVPGPVIALAFGLAVAGLPALHRRGGPAVAVGAAIVLLAGCGQAASGLILASLLGLVVAGLPHGRAATEVARVEASARDGDGVRPSV